MQDKKCLQKKVKNLDLSPSTAPTVQARAARLIIKRALAGRGNIEVTDKIVDIANNG